MKRRLLITLTAWLAWALAACSGAPGARAQPSYTVSAEQLQQAVARRFPLRYPVGGLLDLTLQAPRLRLLPEQNRLNAEMPVEAAGPALQRSHAGSFEVDFALRYEASDRTIRAYQLRVHSLNFPSLPPAASELLNSYGPALAEQALREVVLHQLRPQDLALADGLGLQPGSITVTAKGLVIGFVPKPREGESAAPAAP
ncbi:hypothetical protein [Polaromonas jejuensis]|uniref:DUF1439 domain-containing protein n=1 Tax=Polaromonas jejuensis TaxID=457502 RepID=A0ABW0QF00_9BURK|nr:hypothetical protein [Polaromonas jejuensis]